jgi:uncharacterized membrane protein
MHKGRLEAFSDGVIAIIITIMVLEIKVPHGHDLEALKPLLPIILSYILSFIYIGIYWNNHHHMLQVTQKVNGGILWANLHLLFWLSLVPFVTAWVGENHFESAPMALYGFVLLMAGLSYTILQNVIIRSEGKDSILKAAIGTDWKGALSLVFYITAIVFSYYINWISATLYVLVALIWLIPDRRIECEIERRNGLIN